MDLTTALVELARDHGTALFRDPNAFRGALDDYLDEGTASSGTINLLTDAVRLGALDGMIAMLDSGAGPEAAVESAGQRLARDRGSNDVGGSQWACALLGHALGRVPLDQVQRLDPGAAPYSSPQPQQQLPWSAGQQPPAVSPPASPAGWYGAPPAGPPGAAPAAAAPGFGSWPTAPAPKRRTGLVVGIVAVVAVLVIGGAATGIALAMKGDDEPSAKPGTSTSSSASSSTASSTPPSTTLDGPQISGLGYVMTLPSDQWRDATDDFGAGGGTIDKAAIWGDAMQTARANVIVEASTAQGKTDPHDLETQWKAAIQGASGSATLTDLPERQIDGQEALGIELSRENENGVQIHQEAYLVIHGTSEYSIDYTYRESDSDAETEFGRILDAWKWS